MLQFNFFFYINLHETTPEVNKCIISCVEKKKNKCKIRSIYCKYFVHTKTTSMQQCISVKSSPFTCNYYIAIFIKSHSRKLSNHIQMTPTILKVIGIVGWAGKRQKCLRTYMYTSSSHVLYTCSEPRDQLESRDTEWPVIPNSSTSKLSMS